MTLAVPTITYCTPEMVADTMSLPDPKDPKSQYQFTNLSNPTYDQVCRMIASNEDVIDRRVNQSWRRKTVTNQILDIPRYQHDENSWRSDYFMYGGYKIQLRKDIQSWDPRPIYRLADGTEIHVDKDEEPPEDAAKIYDGDKLETRFFRNGWTDISHGYSDTDSGPDSFHFDFNGGVLYLGTNFLQPRYNAVRISYRYGHTDEPPPAVQRLCCLMTAAQIINSQFWLIKAGMGGDISGIKDSMLRGWQEEVNTLYSSLQRTGSVHSMISR